MNALLINNDNLPSNLTDVFTSTLLFNIPQSKMLEEGFSFDKEAHGQIGKVLFEKSFDVIFMPYALSDNYLELTGLRVALHIRLTPEWNHTKVPIVFIGHEKPEQIARLSDLGSFLFTTGVFTTQKFDVDSLKKQYKWITEEWRPMTEEVFQTFLSRIKLAPPANYTSHHSIDNELALVRWSEYIGCVDKIPNVKENLQAGLYFKYIRALNPISEVTDSKKYLIQGKARILLIDDEAKKGWEDFYKCFFQQSPSITFDTLSVDFKSLTQQDIIDKAVEKVEDFGADIVLLDLRLCDKDFEEDIKPEDFTGYKILQKIKEVNKGIQVIITTASNKVWNYEPLMGAGANGYIIKNGNSNVTEDIRNLKKVVKEGILKANFLKGIAKDVTSIKNLIDSTDELIEEVKISFKSNLDIAFELLEKSFINPKYRNYSYLQLFLIIEDFLNQDSVFESGPQSYVICNTKRFLVLIQKDAFDIKKGFDSAIKFDHGHYHIEKSVFERRIDTNYKMSAVLLFKYGCSTSGEQGWSKIYSIRNNKAAHPENGFVNKEELKILMKFLQFIINMDNIKCVEKDKDLPEPSIDESIEKLKKQWGSK